jgi:serine/threonine-protein kinase RsbW
MRSQSGFSFLTNQSQSARPNVTLSLSIRSEVNAISPLVDKLMALIKKCRGVPRRQHEVELALREALANAVLHGNRQDAGKKVYVCVCIQFSWELSIIVKDEGTGFDHTQLPDPTHVENIKSTHGRGIYLMRALMDDVRFEEGGTEVHMRMRLSRRNRIVADIAVNDCGG